MGDKKPLKTAIPPAKPPKKPSPTKAVSTQLSQIQSARHRPIRPITNPPIQQGTTVTNSSVSGANTIWTNYGIRLTFEGTDQWTQEAVNLIIATLDYLGQQLIARGGLPAGMTAQEAVQYVFGALEFRYRPGYPNRYAQTDSGQLVLWYDEGMEELHREGQRIQNPPYNGSLIIHELGHVLDNRTQHQAEGMREIALGFTVFPPAPEVLNSELELPLRSSWDPDNGTSFQWVIENMADLFLIWVFDGFIDPASSEVSSRIANHISRAVVYTEGGSVTITIGTQSITYNSPGLAFWFTIANEYIQELPNP